jgi:rare lipoprotein A
MRSYCTGVLVLAFLFSGGCAGRDAPPSEIPAVSVAATTPVMPNEIYRERGVASWYGKELQGKKTGSGEVFDMNGISAAHRTLPFGTMIRVTNLDNSKSIKARINDRGPFIKSRILDLSYGAAKKLGFVEQGTTRVQIETVEPVRGTAQYTVQAASYTEESNAKLLQHRLSRKFEYVAIMMVETNIALFYRVQVGSYASEERAEQIANKLRFEGLESIVIRKD